MPDPSIGHEIEGDRAGLGAFRADPVPEGFLYVLRDKRLKLSPRALVLSVSGARSDELSGLLRPAVRRRHIDYPHGWEFGPRRLGAEHAGRFPGLHAAPEDALDLKQNG
jgi:hypothetical protein